jgi:hypothetical protein
MTAAAIAALRTLGPERRVKRMPATCRRPVRVTSMRYNGTIHDFVLLNAITDMPAVRGAIKGANASARSCRATIDRPREPEVESCPPDRSAIGH